MKWFVDNGEEDGNRQGEPNFILTETPGAGVPIQTEADTPLLTES